MKIPIKNLQARIPVIVGAGEVCECGRDPLDSGEPLSLMQQALLRAEQDFGVRMLHDIDSLDIVAELSWSYADVCGLLSARLGIRPRCAVYGEIGGESPVRFLHEAALRIARGESRVAAVAGAEAAYTVAATLKNRVPLPWTPSDPQAKLLSVYDRVHPLAFRQGVAMPAQVYPFYENAAQAHWGQTQRQARRGRTALQRIFAGRRAQSQCLVAADLHADRNHRAFSRYGWNMRVVLRSKLTRSFTGAMARLSSAR